jgi:hypothetical protein
MTAVSEVQERRSVNGFLNVREERTTTIDGGDQISTNPGTLRLLLES